jgi:hypothetical protein
MRVSASMWKAWLSCRLPPRSRRWRSVRPEETGIGAHPERRASCASVWKRWMPPISPNSFAAISTPIPLLGQKLGGELADEAGELLVEIGDRAGQLPNATDHVTHDPHPDLGRGRRAAGGGRP